MLPLETLGRVTTPDGKELALYHRGGAYHIRVDGLELMSNRAHGSEETLAELACERLRRARAPRVLIGGLGFGYTLRATLDLLSHGATVEVAEVFPAIVEWNQRVLGPLAGHPLADPRARVSVGHVGALLKAATVPYDAILLDVDNGPEAFTLESNAGLYEAAGLDLLRRRLKADGTLAVWSASPSRRFIRALRRAGFTARSVVVPARRGNKGPRHTIFLARPAGRRRA